MSGLDPAILKRILALPIDQQGQFADLIHEHDQSASISQARDSFMPYVRHMWPGFIEGRHHRIMGEAFDRIIAGKLKRLIICMGPRFTKSEFSSFLLPSMYMGLYPDRKIIQASHNADLSTDFGRKTRDLLATKRYQEVFPKVSLTPDAKAAGRWTTQQGGTYFAIGVGGKMAGKGADLFIIDDAHSEQDYIRALGGESGVFDGVFEWYQTGPRQRLQPGAAIVVVMTRWHMRDLVGRLLGRMTAGGKDQWEIIEFPAILNGKSLWPEFWPLEELEATRDTLSPQQWAAQYLQNPTAEEGALIKREHWKLWQKDKPPPNCSYIIQSWDTAYKKSERSDYSACTTWGVFDYADPVSGTTKPNIILLDAYKERMEFPVLKRKALKFWEHWKPDATIIEAKASGLPLIYELREIGVPVSEYTPSRGNDKIVRVNAISDLFYSGFVWRPETRWAEEVAEEFAGFPLTSHDDYVDSGTQALLRFRQGGFITLDTDYEEDYKRGRQRVANYY